MVAGYVLPPAKIETVHACEETRSMTVYEIAAKDVEQAISKLFKLNQRSFMLRMGPGKAMLKRGIAIDKADVVLAGEAVALSDPTWRTEIDLSRQNINIARSARLCVQDIRLANGFASGVLGGGAVAVAGRSELRMKRCHVHKCCTEGDGGAVSFYQSSRATLSQCWFSDNRAVREGGALYFNDGNATLSQCTFTANIAEDSTGGRDTHGGVVSLGAKYQDTSIPFSTPNEVLISCLAL